MSNQTTYEIVTQRIIECLENGVAPWRKGWSVQSPRNAISGRKYTGINTLILSLSPYTDPRWATIRQINQLGGRVRKGEHSTAIAFWKRIPITGDEGEIEKVIPFLRFYRVFNIQQTDLNLPALNVRGLEPIAEAERVTANNAQYPNYHS
jgi:antirestriction protein ArdC